MAEERKLRILVAKPGLDGHDRGAKVIARALRDAGFEVIYTGLHQTPEMVVSAAIQEDVDAIGLSIMSGAHMTLCPAVIDLLRGKEAEDIQVFLGGIIPQDDIQRLKDAGVKEIFLPGTSTQDVVAWIKRSIPSSCRGRVVLEKLPARVSVYEVGPRDGLQNEAAIVPTEGKLGFIAALAAAGLHRIEITSFVSPRWIPALADSAEVAARAPRLPGVTYSALVPNAKGLEGAKAAGIDEVAVFLSASETHNQKNVNRTIAESLRGFEEVVGPAKAAGMRVRGYVSTVWGCPYEGAVDPRKAQDIAHTLLNLGCYQVSLGDTIGVGTPRQTERIVDSFLAQMPASALALHFHDTRGTALANALVGLTRGVTTLDASVGGLGGCPYAPGASGNLATEDLVYMLEGLGVAHGVDLERLVEAGVLAQRLVGSELPGRYLKARLGERIRAAERALGE